MRGMSGALVGAVARAVPWRAVGAGAVAGLLVVGVPRMLSDELDPWLGLNLLRGAALVFALGLAFLLDDPARELTTPVTTRRLLRTGLRVALVAPVAALWWTAAVALVPEEARPPVGAVTLEAAATVTLALAVAALAVRLSDEPEPGPSVAAAVLTTACLAPLLLPSRWELFVQADDPRWEAAHQRWAWVLVGAALVWLACGPEPLRRRRVFPRRRAAGAGPSGA